MSKEIKLSDRVRPSAEAAPWVVSAIKKLEDELEAQQRSSVDPVAAANEIADQFKPGFFDAGMVRDVAAIIAKHSAGTAALPAMPAAAYIPVDRQTGEQWPPVKDKGSGAICDYIPLFKRQPAVNATPAAPVEIEYPTYHAQGMGCGLEDRGITDRYEAMAYGFQEAVEQMAVIIGSMGPLYSSPCADGKLTKPAKVGAVRFQPGVSERQVVEAAQRQYEFEVTPEKEALRLAKLVSVVNAIHYQPKPAIRIELVSASPGSGLHIRQWNDLAGLEPGTYELYLPVQP